jgi:hypothetical protein
VERHALGIQVPGKGSEHALAANQAKPEGDHQDAERTIAESERRQQCCTGRQRDAQQQQDEPVGAPKAGEGNGAERNTAPTPASVDPAGQRRGASCRMALRPPAATATSW